MRWLGHGGSCERVIVNESRTECETRAGENTSERNIGQF